MTDGEEEPPGVAGEEKPSADELDLSQVEWLRPDSESDSEGDGAEDEGGGRVEIAFLDDGTTLMRDGEDPEGPVLVFTSQEWEAFVGGVKDGEFDLSETYPGLWRDEEPE